ncbi:unnamed protein product [Didymodactylos carnosus]|uniref:Uncharacterized protein n=1 Tax=Didymodactylos carnosus TaxID=1234261 RepID=A0A814STI2_9BILA|nr:unnamed protein product [Didymodactylos carnosus]CAF3916119.1 unnamed protein product [Didymodactylos carnosus]
MTQIFHFYSCLFLVVIDDVTSANFGDHVRSHYGLRTRWDDYLRLRPAQYPNRIELPRYIQRLPIDYLEPMHRPAPSTPNRYNDVGQLFARDHVRGTSPIYPIRHVDDYLTGAPDRHPPRKPTRHEDMEAILQTQYHRGIIPMYPIREIHDYLAGAPNRIKPSPQKTRFELMNEKRGHGYRPAPQAPIPTHRFGIGY